MSTVQLQRDLEIVQNRIAVIQQAIDDGATGEELAALENDLYESQAQEAQLIRDINVESAFLNPDDLYEAMWTLYQEKFPPPGGVVTPEYAAGSRPQILTWVEDAIEDMPPERQSDFDGLLEGLKENPEFNAQDTEQVLSENLAEVDEAYDNSLGEIPDEDRVQMFGEVAINGNTASITFRGDTTDADFMVEVNVKGKIWKTFIPAGLSPAEVSERVYLETPTDIGVGVNQVTATIAFTDTVDFTPPPTVQFLYTLHVDVEPTVLPSQTCSLIFAGEFLPSITFVMDTELSTGEKHSIYQPIATDTASITDWIALWAADLALTGHWESVVVAGGGYRIDFDAGAGKTTTVMTATIVNQFAPEAVTIDLDPPDMGESQYQISFLGDEVAANSAMWADLSDYTYYALELVEGATAATVAAETAAALNDVVGLDAAIVTGTTNVLVTITDGGTFTAPAPDAAVIFGHEPFSALSTVDASNGTGSIDFAGEHPLGHEVFVTTIADTTGHGEDFTLRLTRSHTPTQCATELAAAINADGSFKAVQGDGASAPTTNLLISMPDGVTTAYIASITIQTLHGSTPITVSTSGAGPSSKLADVEINGGPATGSEWITVDVTVTEGGGDVTRGLVYSASFGQTPEQIATGISIELNDDPLLVVIAEGDRVEIRPADPTQSLTAVVASVSDAAPDVPFAVVVSGFGPESDEVLISVTGGAALGDEQIAWQIALDGGAPLSGSTAVLTIGDDANAAATALATSIGAEADLTAVANGSVVDVSATNGTSKLTDAAAAAVSGVTPLAIVVDADGPTLTERIVTITGGPSLGSDTFTIDLTPDPDTEGAAPYTVTYDPAIGEDLGTIGAAIAGQIDLLTQFTATDDENGIVTIGVDGDVNYIPTAVVGVAPATFNTPTSATACPINKGAAGEIRIEGGISAGGEQVTVTITLTSGPLAPVTKITGAGQALHPFVASLAEDIDDLAEVHATSEDGLINVTTVDSTVKIVTIEVVVA